MKKLLVLILAIFALFIMCLSACSSADADNDKVDSKKQGAEEVEEITELPSSGDDSAFLVTAYTYLTEGRFDEAIDAFSTAKNQIDAPNILLEIGLGKALFNKEDYEGAQMAFEAAVKLDPGRIDIQRYLGETQMLTGNYEQSSETFRLVLKNEPDDKAIFGKLEKSLRRSNQYEELFQLFEEYLESAIEADQEKEEEDDDISEVGFYAGKLLEAAFLMGDESLTLSVIERFSDDEFGSLMELGYTAYQSIKSGDEETAKELLFDFDNIQTENYWSGNLYFGEFNDYGEYEGTGFTISYNSVHIGDFKEYVPNGFGISFSGYLYEWDDDGTAMFQKSSNFIESNWVDGIPDGDVVSTDEWATYNGDTLQYSGKSITTAFYSDGMAQGEVWRESQSTYRRRTYTSYTKHVVEDGIPVPFEASIRRRGTTMVYEAFGDSRDRFNWAYEEECNCEFIFR